MKRTVPVLLAALTLALALPLTGCKKEQQATEDQSDVMKAAAAISAVAAKRPVTEEEMDAIWKAIEDAEHAENRGKKRPLLNLDKEQFADPETRARWGVEPVSK